MTFGFDVSLFTVDQRLISFKHYFHFASPSAILDSSGLSQFLLGPAVIRLVTSFLQSIHITY